MTARRISPIVVALFLFAGVARADPTPEQVEEGRTRFQKGVALFRGGDFKAALAEFNGAYAAAPSFRIQFNIAQTCAELQDHVCAQKAFESYLAGGGKQVPADKRATAEKELKRLQGLLGKVRILVNVPDADVTIDDAPAGTSPIADPVLVTAGKRKISAKKASFTAASSIVDVPAGETVEVTLALAGADGTIVTPVATGRAGAAPPDRTRFWIGVAATGALTLGTIVVGALTLGAKSDLDATANRFGTSASDLRDASSKVDTLAVVTDVFAVGALAAAGVTAYFFFESGFLEHQATQIGVGPGSLMLKHAF